MVSFAYCSFFFPSSVAVSLARSFQIQKLAYWDFNFISCGSRVHAMRASFA